MHYTIKHFFLLLLAVCFIGIQDADAQRNRKKKNKVDEYYYWGILEGVTIKSKFNIETENFENTPTFKKAVKALDGKKIFLKGFIIPADLTKGRMTLSKFSYSSCYFCGAAGPESVIEIEATTPIIYRMDKPITLEGILKINETDPFRLLYILENATYYEGKS
jgi:hypothetical protein